MKIPFDKRNKERERTKTQCDVKTEGEERRCTVDTHGKERGERAGTEQKAGTLPTCSYLTGKRSREVERRRFAEMRREC